MRCVHLGVCVWAVVCFFERCVHCAVCVSGEKNRCERSEIEPETVCLQSVRAEQSAMACLLFNESASQC